jgi:hypothetical protein
LKHLLLHFRRVRLDLEVVELEWVALGESKLLHLVQCFHHVRLGLGLGILDGMAKLELVQLVKLALVEQLLVPLVEWLVLGEPVEWLVLGELEEWTHHSRLALAEWMD